jgi:hypothetical protein
VSLTTLTQISSSFENANSESAVSDFASTYIDKDFVNYLSSHLNNYRETRGLSDGADSGSAVFLTVLMLNGWSRCQCRRFTRVCLTILMLNELSLCQCRRFTSGLSDSADPGFRGLSGNVDTKKENPNSNQEFKMFSKDTFYLKMSIMNTKTSMLLKAKNA